MISSAMRLIAGQPCLHLALLRHLRRRANSRELGLLRGAFGRLNGTALGGALDHEISTNEAWTAMVRGP